MIKHYRDVWKHPHMTYKKAFSISAVITVIGVVIAFISFSDYIESHMTNSLQVNFLTEQEAQQKAEDIKEQIQEEKQRELQNDDNHSANGGGGHGGQNGTSSSPIKSDVTPSTQKANAGEVGTVKQSSVGSNNGDGLTGEPDKGVGQATTGEQQGNSPEEGNGGTQSGTGGGGTFSYDGYWENLQSAINRNYPSQARMMGIQGDVTLRVYFSPGGAVASVKVLYSDDPILSEHAQEYAYSMGGAENSTGEQQYADVTIHYNL